MLNDVDALRLSDFDYHLPESLIAQEPSPVRDMSRLLVLERSTGNVHHRIFSDIGEFLSPGDVLVLNNTRVFPCRLVARKKTGGRAEILLFHERELNLWDALVKGSVKAGSVLIISGGIEADVVSEGDDGVKTLRFKGVPDIRDILHSIGKTPLPPYIKREQSSLDQERYQTVYAKCEGAVAAPTAGLHFTEELLQRLRSSGVGIATITLHVGPGTFQPVKTDNIKDHQMHYEYYSVPEEAADVINNARHAGRKVIAVGTTSVRTIETAANPDGFVSAGEGRTNLFIRPGYRFKATDGMITNFHLPKSTLLMLVAAFAGLENILSAYRIAIAERYRFYSYGDAMLIF